MNFINILIVVLFILIEDLVILADDPVPGAQIQTVLIDLRLLRDKICSAVISVDPQIRVLPFRDKCKPELSRDLEHQLVPHEAGITGVGEKDPFSGFRHAEHGHFLVEPDLIAALVIIIPGGISPALELRGGVFFEIVIFISRIDERSTRPLKDRILMIVHILKRCVTQSDPHGRERGLHADERHPALIFERDHTRSSAEITGNRLLLRIQLTDARLCDPSGVADGQIPGIRAGRKEEIVSVL